MKLVVISDLHLDQSTSGVDRFDDVKVVLESAVEHALEINADGFVFLGDLADPNTVRVHRSLDALGSAMRGLREAGIPVICVAGNHDVIEDGSGLTVLDTLRWVDAGPVCTVPCSFEFHRDEKFICTVVALPFTATSKNYNPDAFIRSLPKLEPPVVVMGHLNLRGITLGSESIDMPRGRDVFWPLEALRECLPDALLLGGHYHTRQVFEGVHIIGSAVRLRFDEKDNNPGFTVVEL